RLDGRVRGRTAQAERLPQVRGQGRSRTGRFRIHGGGPAEAVRPPGDRRRRGRPDFVRRSPEAKAAGEVRLSALPGGGGWRAGATVGGRTGPERMRALDPGHRAGEATGGGLSPGPARTAG